MRIWGIGSNWDSVDVSGEFREGGYVQIGWTEPQAPGLYVMLGQIAIGDMVYIKSRSFGDKTLRIKAIGKAISAPYISRPSDRGTINVVWLKEFDEPIIHSITEEEYRYNVYNNTLYEEFNPGIIKELMDQVKERI